MKILFYKAKGEWIDSVIRTVTKGPYSHCELMFSDGTCFSSSPREKGVRFKKIDIKEDNWDILTLSRSDELAILQWCSKYLGQKYDWLGAVSSVYPVIPNQKNRWFCSEICIKCLKENNIIDKHLLPTKSSPNQFFNKISELDFLK